MLCWKEGYRKKSGGSRAIKQLKREGRWTGKHESVYKCTVCGLYHISGHKENLKRN